MHAYLQCLEELLHPWQQLQPHASLVCMLLVVVDHNRFHVFELGSSLQHYSHKLASHKATEAWEAWEGWEATGMPRSGITAVSQAYKSHIYVHLTTVSPAHANSASLHHPS